MRAAALLGIMLLQAGAANEPPVAQPQHMRYERSLAVASGVGQACAVLDAAIFPHAAPSLSDLRIFPVHAAGAHEVPYAITLSEAVTQETQPAQVLNLGTVGGDSRGANIAFDLEMPDRPYTSVTLNLDPEIHDFLAAATVSGSDALGGGAKSTALGTFTLFDLTSQHLSRDTTLPLEESTFRYLHVVLSVSAAPGGTAPGEGFTPAMVLGAEVPPSREAQILYTTVAETTSIATVGRESIAKFQIPPRVPVERVSFVLPAGFKGNFSRDVRVKAVAEPAAKGAATEAGDAGGDMDEDGRAPLPEIVTGNILRVHANEAGREIHTEQLGVPAILGANLQRPATVEVDIENGDDLPLPLAAVRLEMRQRKLCFDTSSVAADAAPASGGPGLALFYGDPALSPPEYDYQRLFVASDKPLKVELGPEQLNPDYTPRPAAPLSFTERYPQLLWIALIVVICVLGLVALKGAKNVGR